MKKQNTYIIFNKLKEININTNNFDKYKHIAIMDNDETVIPKLTKFIGLNEVIDYLNEITSTTSHQQLNIDHQASTI